MKPKHIKARIKQCEAIAECSDCPRAKFGCIIVDPISNTVRGEGYNNGSAGSEGPLCGGSQCIREILNIKSGTQCEQGCIHAEFNAIVLAARNGIKTDGCWVFVNGEPCLMCSKAIHHAGIKRIIVTNGKYSHSGIMYLVENGVQVSLIEDNKLYNTYLIDDAKAGYVGIYEREVTRKFVQKSDKHVLDLLTETYSL